MEIKNGLRLLMVEEPNCGEWLAYIGAGFNRD